MKATTSPGLEKFESTVVSNVIAGSREEAGSVLTTGIKPIEKARMHRNGKIAYQRCRRFLFDFFSFAKLLNDLEIMLIPFSLVFVEIVSLWKLY